MCSVPCFRLVLHMVVRYKIALKENVPQSLSAELLHLTMGVLAPMRFVLELIHAKLATTQEWFKWFMLLAFSRSHSAAVHWQDTTSAPVMQAFK